MLKYNVIPRKSPVDKSVKYYGQLVPVTPVKMADLAENISKECTVTVHDVKAVLSALEEQLISQLRSGRSVRLGDLGSFRPTIGSEGVAQEADFTVSNIKGVRVRFLGSANLRYNLSKQHPSVAFQNAKA